MAAPRLLVHAAPSVLLLLVRRGRPSAVRQGPLSGLLFPVPPAVREARAPASTGGAVGGGPGGVAVLSGGRGDAAHPESAFLWDCIGPAVGVGTGYPDA